MNISVPENMIWTVTIYILCAGIVSCSDKENVEIKNDSHQSVEKSLGKMKISHSKPPLYGRPLRDSKNVRDGKSPKKEPLSELPKKSKPPGVHKGTEITIRSINTIDHILKEISKDRVPAEIEEWKKLVSSFPDSPNSEEFVEKHIAHFLGLQKLIKKDLGDDWVVKNQADYDKTPKEEQSKNLIRSLTVLDENENCETSKKRYGFPLRIIGIDEDGRYMRAIKMSFIPGPKPKSESDPHVMYIAFFVLNSSDTYKLVAAVIYKINKKGRVKWEADYGGDISAFIYETITRKGVI